MYWCSGYYYFQNHRIKVPEKVGCITELTTLHWYQSHSHAGWWYLFLPIVNSCMSGGNKFDTNTSPLFQADAQYKTLESRHTALSSKFRGSTPRTGQTWREWVSFLVRQRRANCALLGGLVMYEECSMMSAGVLSLPREKTWKCISVSPTKV